MGKSHVRLFIVSLLVLFQLQFFLFIFLDYIFFKTSLCSDHHKNVEICIFFHVLLLFLETPDIRENGTFCWFSIFDRSTCSKRSKESLCRFKTFFVPFAQIFEYFIILWFRTSLDMFTYDFEIDWYELTGYFKTSLDLSSICLMHFTIMWNRYVVK